MFRIGEFARFTRVSVKMLRHYDEIGLLPPARVDPATGYRYYSTAQLPRLNRILLLREMGFGLDEVATLVEKDLDAIYEERERAVVDALSTAQAQLRALRARRDLLRDSDDPPPDVVVRPVPALLVAQLPIGPGDDVSTLFTRLEEHVAGHGGRAAQPPLAIDDEHGAAVAVPLTWAIPAAGGVTVRRLPAVARMACAVHSGGYAGLPGLFQQMLRWLEQTGQRPAGPVREVYLSFAAAPELALPPAYLVTERADLVTELQVPLTDHTDHTDHTGLTG